MSTNRTRKPASSIPTAYGGASTRKAKSKSASISKATRCRRTPNVSIAPDGSFGHEIAPYNDEERTITRHIHSRVVMNYHTARAMLEWLEDKVAALEAEEDGSAPLSFDESGFQHQ